MTPMLLPTYDQDLENGPVVTIPGMQAFQQTQSYREDFEVPPHLTAQQWDYPNSHTNPIYQPSPSYVVADHSIAKDDGLPHLVNLPFLRSQILKEEFEDPASKQADSEKVAKTQRGKKRKMSLSYSSACDHSDEADTFQTCTNSNLNVSKKGKAAKVISRPRNPQRLQAALHLMAPMILYIQYNCIQRCRSQGTCVHFSFMVHGRALPDGLVCQMCRASGCEEGHEVDRMCTRHRRFANTQTVTNHPEDEMVDPHEMLAATEKLRKAWMCDWEHLPGSHVIANDQVVQSLQYYEMAGPEVDGTQMHEMGSCVSHIHSQKRMKVCDQVENEPTFLAGHQAGERSQPASFPSEALATSRDNLETDIAFRSGDIGHDFTQNGVDFTWTDQTLHPLANTPSLEWLLMQPLVV